MMVKQTTDYFQLGLAVIETEAQAIQNLARRFNKHAFNQACELLLEVKGRIIVLGMGKSGHIGNKIAATLASTGTPAFFVHPAEASHGDLGMITADDAVIVISHSGNTQEIITLLPLLKRLNIPVISLTGNPNSTLAKHAQINLDVSVESEACPLGLAPTTSTTVALVMGDALAIALLQARGFTKDDFARAHPGGTLGLRLLVRVSDLMHAGDELPQVTCGVSLSDALLEMSAKKLGITCVVNQNRELIGIFTDGDLRRALQQQLDLQNTLIDTVMTPTCKTISKDTLADEALNLLERHKITALIVADENNIPIGIVHMHTLLARSMGIK